MEVGHLIEALEIFYRRFHSSYIHSTKYSFQYKLFFNFFLLEWFLRCIYYKVVVYMKNITYIINK